MTKTQRENKWGLHPANGGFAPERFPAFTIELVDHRESEGPGNVSSTDYRLVVSDGGASVEIETTNRRGLDLFEFRGQKYAYQVHDGDDGISYTVFPVSVGAGGVWSEIQEQGPPLPWLPFELDGVRIDENTDLSALVARTLGGWTPPAARPFERETAARWALKLWSALRGTGLEDEVARAAGAGLRSTDPLIRAAALRFFDRVGQVPGSEVIEEVAAASDVDPLDRVPDPTYPSSAVPLGRSVRIGLSNRIRHLRKAGVDPGRALAIAKSLILQSGRGVGLVTAVSECDWRWFEWNAEEIVKATPQACVEVLMTFPEPDEDDPEEDTGMLAARLASIPGIDTEELLLWAESSLSADALATVQAVLDARTHTGRTASTRDQYDEGASLETKAAVQVLRESIAGSETPWVLFSHGTVVLIQEREADLTTHAIELMKKWGPVQGGGPAADFRVVELKSNQGWVVTSHNNDILTLVLPSEVAPNAMAVMIGLLGRGKRDEDARDLLVVHVEDAAVAGA